MRSAHELRNHCECQVIEWVAATGGPGAVFRTRSQGARFRSRMRRVASRECEATFVLQGAGMISGGLSSVLDKQMRIGARGPVRFIGGKPAAWATPLGVPSFFKGPLVAVLVPWEERVVLHDDEASVAGGDGRKVVVPVELRLSKIVSG